MIEHLSTETWKKILELLGSGDFVRISFRPPAYEGELADLAEMNGFIANGSWWICEAVYHKMNTWPGGRGTWHEVTQKIPFKLTP